jgi:hypothetical protein
MKKTSIGVAKQSRNISRQRLTIGLDLGDRNSWYCVVDEAGQIQVEQRVRSIQPHSGLFESDRNLSEMGILRKQLCPAVFIADECPPPLVFSLRWARCRTLPE